MYISRKNSQILAISILVFFFIGAATYISLNSSRDLTARKSPSPQEESVKSSERTRKEEAANSPKEENQEQIANVNNETSEASPTEAPKNEPTFSLKDFHRSETRDGKTLWEITGSEAKLSDDKKAIVINDCELEYYSKEESPILIHSNKAEIKLLGAQVSEAKFIGDVVLTHSKNSKLLTEEATYFKVEDRLTAPGKVKIKGDWYKTTGVGLEGDLQKKEFRILKNIKSTLDPSSKDKKKG